MIPVYKQGLWKKFHLFQNKIQNITDKTFLNELAKYHVSGQLRVAPEHVSNQVLKYMGKPSHEVYEKFLKEFDKANKKAGLQQFAVPYFMSSHPAPYYIVLL